MLLGAVASQGEEHIVETWPDKPKILDSNVGFVEPAGDPSQIRQSRCWSGEGPSALIDKDLIAGATEKALCRRKIRGVSYSINLFSINNRANSVNNIFLPYR